MGLELWFSSFRHLITWVPVAGLVGSMTMMSGLDVISGHLQSYSWEDNRPKRFPFIVVSGYSVLD